MEQPKKLLVLDLDNTLIYTKIEETKDCNFVFEAEGRKFWVKKRPFLDVFLRELSNNYILAIWSASKKEYMDQILSVIIPKDIPLLFVYDRTKCVKKVYNWGGPEVPIFIKPLSKIWRRKRQPYTKKNTLVLDDRPITYSRNYGNGISVIGYYGKEDDTELISLLCKLKILAVAEDVRAIHH